MKDPKKTAQMERRQPATDLRGMSILTVNSCPVCCAILLQVLEEMQLKFDSIKSASGALMLLSNSVERGNPYQLVLIGQFLEDMLGLEFAQLVAKHDFSEPQKILLVNPEDFSLQVPTLDVAGLISTPTRPSDLSAAINDVFGASADLHDTTTEISIRWQQTKVLLVDDNEMGRQMGRALLENVGIEVFAAKNGLEAVAMVEVNDFDLVLMDVQMPVLDGLSATRAIRSLDKKKIDSLPIIAMTANAFTEHRIAGRAAGMNDHLTKPIDLETLYGMLQRWLPEAKQKLMSCAVRAEYSEYADLQAALPGVDVNAGIRRVVGDRQLYVELLKKYIDQFSETEAELYRELVRGQQKDAIRRVHSLKGVAGSLGVTALYQSARQLEEQLTGGEKPLVLDVMLAEHKQFLAALQNLPELNQSSAEGDKLSGSCSELQTILQQILPPLKSLQIQGIKPLLGQVQKKVWPEEYRDQLVQLEEQIACYQFTLATDLVESLLQDMRA